jgi:hypothetical protein
MPTPEVSNVYSMSFVCVMRPRRGRTCTLYIYIYKYITPSGLIDINILIYNQFQAYSTIMFCVVKCPTTGDPEWVVSVFRVFHYKYITPSGLIDINILIYDQSQLIRQLCFVLLSVQLLVTPNGSYLCFVCFIINI